MRATIAPPIPGPRGWDLLRRLRRSQRDPLAEWEDARERFGDVVRYRTGQLPVFLVSHPDDVQRVLQGNWKNYRKGLVNRPLVPLLGRGLLTNEGEDWLAQRRLVQPAFHRGDLEALAPVMAEEAEQVADAWIAAAGTGEPIDVPMHMHRLTFAIAGRALLGTRLRMDDALGRAFATAVEHVNFRSRHPLSAPDWIPTLRNRRARRATAELDRLVRHIIRRRREEGGEGSDVLSLLLAARDADTGRGLDEQQLRDEALTFLVAGHETSANMLAWTWHLLARHPATLAAVRAEAESVVGGERVTAEHLPRLVHTRRVLEESLRLFPPSVVLPRQANGPDELGGHPIPADAVVLVSQYVVHRHPEFWPEAERFDPERFDPAAAAGRHRFAYIPFGGGPRICIGREFALMEGQIVLATLCRSVMVAPAPGATVVPDVTVTLRPRGLRLIARR